MTAHTRDKVHEAAGLLQPGKRVMTLLSVLIPKYQRFKALCKSLMWPSESLLLQDHVMITPSLGQSLGEYQLPIFRYLLSRTLRYGDSNSSDSRHALFRAEVTCSINAHLRRRPLRRLIISSGPQSQSYQ